MNDLKKLLELFQGCDTVKFILTDCGEEEFKTVDFKKAVEQIEKIKEKNKVLAKENRKLKKEMIRMMNYSRYKQEDKTETESTKSFSDVWSKQEEKCEQRTLDNLKTLVDKSNKN